MECVFACQTLAYFDESDSLFLFVKQYLLALPASFLPRAQREAALLRTFYNHRFPLPSNISSVTAVAELLVPRFFHLLARWLKSFVFSSLSFRSSLWKKKVVCFRGLL